MKLLLLPKVIFQVTAYTTHISSVNYPSLLPSISNFISINKNISTKSQTSATISTSKSP